MAMKGKKGKKRICNKCRKSVCKCEKSDCQVARPVREIPVEAAEPPNPEDWEIPCSACEEVKDPEPIPEAVGEAVEPAAAENWEIPCSACEEVKDPEPIPEAVGEAVEPAAAENWEIPCPACEEVKDPEPIPEDAGEAVEPAVAEESDSANMPTAGGLVICEYVQPKSSPYEGDPVKIMIGRSKKWYTVPMNIVSQASYLQQHWDEDECGRPTVRLPEVDDDIGHTLIHYLYTGDYQTLKPSSTYNMPRRAVEYSRSVLAYHAALRCGLDGLADQARKYIQIFDKDISIFDIIALGRKTFPRITEDAWYSEYLTTKIMASFETEEGIFQQEEFFKGFGEAPDFDKFLGKIMAKAYAHRLSSIRNASDLRMFSKSTMAMAMSRESAANNKYNSASTVPGRRNEQYSYAESQIYRSRESSPKLPPSTDYEAWLKWKEDRCPEVESSRVSLLTPRSSSGEMSDERYVGETQEWAHKLDSDLGYGGCPHWQQHSRRENLRRDCPRCKSYILNMFADLILNSA